MKLRTFIALTAVTLAPAVCIAEPASPGPVGTPAASTATVYTPAYPASNGFNWFDPNAWMAMFFNPVAWNSASLPAAPSAAPATTPVQTPWQNYGYTGYAAPANTGYPAGAFNWFDPNAWMGIFFNPASWMQTPAAAAPGK